MMAVEIHLVMKLGGKTASADFPPAVSLESASRIVLRHTRMFDDQTGWQLSTIRFDPLELPKEAGSMLRDMVVVEQTLSWSNKLLRSPGVIADKLPGFRSGRFVVRLDS